MRGKKGGRHRSAFETSLRRDRTDSIRSLRYSFRKLCLKFAYDREMDYF